MASKQSDAAAEKHFRSLSQEKKFRMQQYTEALEKRIKAAAEEDQAKDQQLVMMRSRLQEVSEQIREKDEDKETLLRELRARERQIRALHGEDVEDPEEEEETEHVADLPILRWDRGTAARREAMPRSASNDSVSSRSSAQSEASALSEAISLPDLPPSRESSEFGSIGSSKSSEQDVEYSEPPAMTGPKRPKKSWWSFGRSSSKAKNKPKGSTSSKSVKTAEEGDGNKSDSEAFAKPPQKLKEDKHVLKLKNQSEHLYKKLRSLSDEQAAKSAEIEMLQVPLERLAEESSARDREIADLLQQLHEKEQELALAKQQRASPRNTPPQPAVQTTSSPQAHPPPQPFDMHALWRARVAPVAVPRHLRRRRRLKLAKKSSRDADDPESQSQEDVDDPSVDPGSEDGVDGGSQEGLSYDDGETSQGSSLDDSERRPRSPDAQRSDEEVEMPNRGNNLRTGELLPPEGASSKEAQKQPPEPPVASRKPFRLEEPPRQLHAAPTGLRTGEELPPPEGASSKEAQKQPPEPPRKPFRLDEPPREPHAAPTAPARPLGPQGPKDLPQVKEPLQRRDPPQDLFPAPPASAPQPLSDGSDDSESDDSDDSDSDDSDQSETSRRDGTQPDALPHDLGTPPDDATPRGDVIPADDVTPRHVGSPRDDESQRSGSSHRSGDGDEGGSDERLSSGPDVLAKYDPFDGSPGRDDAHDLQHYDQHHAQHPPDPYAAASYLDYATYGGQDDDFSDKYATDHHPSNIHQSGFTPPTTTHPAISANQVTRGSPSSRPDSASQPRNGSNPTPSLWQPTSTLPASAPGAADGVPPGDVPAWAWNGLHYGSISPTSPSSAPRPTAVDAPWVTTTTQPIWNLSSNPNANAAPVGSGSSSHSDRGAAAPGISPTYTSVSTMASPVALIHTANRLVGTLSLDDLALRVGDLRSMIGEVSTEARQHVLEVQKHCKYVVQVLANELARKALAYEQSLDDNRRLEARLEEAISEQIKAQTALDVHVVNTNISAAKLLADVDALRNDVRQSQRQRLADALSTASTDGSGNSESIGEGQLLHLQRRVKQAEAEITARVRDLQDQRDALERELDAVRRDTERPRQLVQPPPPTAAGATDPEVLQLRQRCGELEDQLRNLSRTAPAVAVPTSAPTLSSAPTPLNLAARSTQTDRPHWPSPPQRSDAAATEVEAARVKILELQSLLRDEKGNLATLKVEKDDMVAQLRAVQQELHSQVERHSAALEAEKARRVHLEKDNARLRKELDDALALARAGEALRATQRDRHEGQGRDGTEQHDVGIPDMRAGDEHQAMQRDRHRDGTEHHHVSMRDTPAGNQHEAMQRDRHGGQIRDATEHHDIRVRDTYREYGPERDAGEGQQSRGQAASVRPVPTLSKASREALQASTSSSPPAAEKKGTPHRHTQPHLNVQAQRVRDQLDDMTPQRDDARQQVGSPPPHLNVQAQRLREQLDDTNRQRDDARQQVGNGNPHLNVQAQRLREQVDDTNRQRNDARQQVGSGNPHPNVQAQRLREQVDDTNRQRDDARQQVGSGNPHLNVQAQRLREQLDDMTRQRDDARQQVASLERDLALALAGTRTAEDDVRSYRLKLSEAKQQHAVLQKSVSDARGEVAALAAQLERTHQPSQTDGPGFTQAGSRARWGQAPAPHVANAAHADEVPGDRDSGLEGKMAQVRRAVDATAEVVESLSRDLHLHTDLGQGDGQAAGAWPSHPSGRGRAGVPERRGVVGARLLELSEAVRSTRALVDALKDQVVQGREVRGSRDGDGEGSRRVMEVQSSELRETRRRLNDAEQRRGAYLHVIGELQGAMQQCRGEMMRLLQCVQEKDDRLRVLEAERKENAKKMLALSRAVELSRHEVDKLIVHADRPKSTSAHTSHPAQGQGQGRAPYPYRPDHQRDDLDHDVGSMAVSVSRADAALREAHYVLAELKSARNLDHSRIAALQRALLAIREEVDSLASAMARKEGDIASKLQMYARTSKPSIHSPAYHVGVSSA